MPSPQLQALQQQLSGLQTPQMRPFDTKGLYGLAQSNVWANALSRGTGGSGVGSNISDILNIQESEQDQILNDWKAQLTSRKANLDSQIDLEKLLIEQAESELRGKLTKQQTKTEKGRTSKTKSEAYQAKLQSGLDTAGFPADLLSRIQTPGLETDLLREKIGSEKALQEQRSGGDLSGKLQMDAWADKVLESGIDPSSPLSVAAFNVKARRNVMNVDDESYIQKAIKGDPELFAMTQGGKSFPEPYDIEGNPNPAFDDFLFAVKNEDPNKSDVMKILDKTVVDLIKQAPSQGGAVFDRAGQKFLRESFIDLVSEPEYFGLINNDSYFKETLKDVADKVEMNEKELLKLIGEKFKMKNSAEGGTSVGNPSRSVLLNKRKNSETPSTKEGVKKFVKPAIPFRGF